MASTFHRITRTYTTASGGSAFEDIQVPLNTKSWIGSLSAGTEVYEIVFRETDGAYDLDWHTAPCRQFIIMVDVESLNHSALGGVDVTTTDGENRRFQDGDVLLVEDTTGKGHRSRAVDGKPRKSILVKLRDNAPPFEPEQQQQPQQPPAAGSMLDASSDAARQ